MRDKITVALVALACAGCATPSDRRSNAPDLELSSSKPSKEVAICISEKWENTKPFQTFSSLPVNLLMRNNGYSVMATDIRVLASSTVALADISDLQTGSSTKYYKQQFSGFGVYDDAVKDCQ